MENNITKLFVYGSLRSGFHHSAYEYISKYFTLISEAKVKGKMYDLGSYPAAVPTTDESFITGELYDLINPADFAWAIEQLDDYEGLNPEEGEEQLFKRELTNVFYNGQQTVSWIYWYNGIIEDHPLIISGDILEFHFPQKKILRRMEVPTGKKIYFLSDFHLGAPDHETSLEREKIIVRFLESIRTSAAAIFIVGDMFDFWFEYKHVTPKGYVRLLGKLAEITDSGIPVHFFVGNHDMWMRGYFEKELNIPVYFEPKTFDFDGKKFFIGHGDGLGPEDHGYKLLKTVFRNKVSQFLFGMLHPFLGELDWPIFSAGKAGKKPAMPTMFF